MKPPLLSILTPACWNRVEQGRALHEKLIHQPGFSQIEHLVLYDNRARSIGMKRQALLESARGDFIAFGDRHPSEHAGHEGLHGDGPIGLDLPIRGDDERQGSLRRRHRGHDGRGAGRTLRLFAGSEGKEGHRRERKQSARGIGGEPAREALRYHIIWHSQGRTAGQKRRSAYDSKAGKRHGDYSSS